MLGSFHDAEDAVQETFLRAWRHRATFEARSSLRAWLYRIATNVCLTQRKRRHVRERSIPLAAGEAIPHTIEESVPLSPYPDALLDELEGTTSNPAAVYDLRESVQLAFLAAVQLLPPRQRAVLILRDVAGFSATEVAELLETTVASVNSALNRARGTVEEQRQAGRLQQFTAPSDDVAESLVQRYVQAWQTNDVSKLISLLKDDVVMTMPPLPLRYGGREHVVRFLSTIPANPADRQDFQFVATRANRQPAIGVYRHGRAWALFVLTADGEALSQITAFIDPAIFDHFRLAPTLRQP
jgi:RNA polymerase sigma-70 factor (ECF subfamily)